MKNLFLLSLFITFLTSTAHSATKYTVTGKVTGTNAPGSALFITKTGVIRGNVKNSKFSFKGLSEAQLKNGKLYFFKDGQPLGPGVLKEKSGAKFFSFSGKAPKDVSKLNLTLESKTGYFLAKKVNAAWIGKTKVLDANFTGASLGYPGSATTSIKSVKIKDSVSDVGADSDLDGVPDVLDIDDDNDTIPDDRDSGGGSMISTLYLNFASTVNAHLGNLNDASIQATLAGENIFGLTFFISVSDALAGGTGGHVVCDPSQVICRSQADGGTTSIYSGVSESDPAVKNQIWSGFNADGSGKPNLELISFGSSNVLVAAIQPRSAAFSAGEALTANVTNGSRTLGSRIFTVLPPVISSPMLLSYDSGAGTTTVDYTNPSAPGSSSGSPIVLTRNTMVFNFYPPQREAITGVEADGAYRDIGNSRIGILLGGAGISQEFTCAGFYSALSTNLTEAPASVSMPGGTVLGQSGAVLWPITDATSDVLHTEGALKSFTVDLAGCLNRGGASPGSYLATITYAGSDTNFGAPRSGQNVFITIPSPS